MRILLVGASGFLGRETYRALLHVSEVVRGARRPRFPEWVRIDLQDAGTYDVVHSVDGVINCSDSIDASGVAFARYCLDRGKFFLEPAHCTERIREYLEHRADMQTPQGHLLIGCGLFPGLSNVVAREASELLPGATKIDLGVQVDVLSGAGRCMCRHMAQHLRGPAFWYTDNHRLESPGIRTGRNMVGLSASGRTARVPFCETEMMRRTLYKPSIATCIALVPSPVTLTLGPTSLLARRVPGFHWILERSMIVMRAWLLAGRPASVTIAAAVSRDERTTVGVTVSCKDGVKAAAAVLAHAAKKMACDSNSHRPGVYLPEEWFSLEELVEGMNVVNAATGWVNPIRIKRWRTGA